MLVLALTASLLLQITPAGRVPVTDPVVATSGFSGWVVDDSGTPLSGVIVSSSAGGEVRTSADGSFLLELFAPPGAETIRLYAELPAGDAPMPPPLLGELEAFVVPGQTTTVGSLVLSANACTERWIRTFGELAGAKTGRVEAIASFDHGTGPRLYLGGTFNAIGGLRERYLACWNGQRYIELGAGVDGPVSDFLVHDDGSGPGLYVAGSFQRAGELVTRGIARWDGTAWSDVGDGLTGNGAVEALCVYDSGNGPELHASGFFSSVGGVPANSIAKWDGSAWSALKGGLNSTGRAMAVYDKGSGPLLAVGGSFTQAGILSANFLATWDGNRWGGLPAILPALPVHALAATGTPPNQVLHVGGAASGFGDPAGYTYSFANTWVRPYPGLVTEAGSAASVYALAVHTVGAVEEVFLGGNFLREAGVSQTINQRYFASHTGGNLGEVGTGLGAKTKQRVATEVSVVETDRGTELGVGGFFTRAGTKVAHRVATWDGTEFHAIGTGLESEVSDVVEFDDGSGPALFVGGAFKSFGDTRAAGVAKWDGSVWAPVGGGGPLIPSITKVGSVEALAVHDDGSGPALWAGGKYAGIDGVSADAIAKFDGSVWTAVGPGFPGGLVIDLASFDDGTGAELYAAGDLDPGGALHLVAWDGSSWQEVGGGTSAPVRTLGVFDLGAGPVLVVGGQFDLAGGVTVNRIATWDGATWAPLGDGFDGDVNALEWWDDGSGPALYAAGRFQNSGSTPVRRLARWNGTAWTPLGSGCSGEVFALAGLDLGEGPTLYAGGDFLVAGVGAASRLARWNGADWAPVQRGLPSRVRRLYAYDDGTGPSLLVGGIFATSPGRDSYLARFGCD